MLTPSKALGLQNVDFMPLFVLYPLKVMGEDIRIMSILK